MSNRVDRGYKVCCDSYRGRLRTIKAFWWLHGLAGCLVGLGHNVATVIGLENII